MKNGTQWTSLHGMGAESVALADVDGNGRDEVIVGFGAKYGLWQLNNLSQWVLLHGTSPEGITPVVQH